MKLIWLAKKIVDKYNKMRQQNYRLEEFWHMSSFGDQTIIKYYKDNMGHYKLNLTDEENTLLFSLIFGEEKSK